MKLTEVFRCRRDPLIAACAAFVAVSCANPLEAQDTATPAPTLQEQLQEALDDWAAQPGHRGVSASVIMPNGNEWVGTAGMEASGSPLLPEHLVWIASITKTMTGAIILELSEEGQLGLDDPISRWLDAMDNVDPEITIRQLLNHTNGLANYTRSANLGQLIGLDSEHVFTAEELIGEVGPPSFAPGERTQYTNSSFVLLGMIAEAVTGEPIVDLYHERLWDPLGLDEIFLPGHEPPPGPVARAWVGQSQEAVFPLDQMSLLSIGNSAFGLFSNARTVARWGRALFTGSVFDQNTFDQMVDFVPAAGNIPGETGAGLGIRGYGYLGRTQWGHSGGSSMGSSLMLFDPETGITVAVIMNQGRGAQHFALAPRLLEIAASH